MREATDDGRAMNGSRLQVQAQVQLQIDSRLDATGREIHTHLELVATEDGSERLRLTDSLGFSGDLPAVAVERVLARFGRELDPDVAAAHLATSPMIGLAGGAQLRQMRFHAIVAAEARDYLVWQATPTAAPIAAIATTVTAALRHLLAAASRPSA